MKYTVTLEVRTLIEITDVEANCSEEACDVASQLAALFVVKKLGKGPGTIEITPIHSDRLS